MKVTAVSTLITAGGHANWIFVKVETDSGITGWGEATLEWRDGPVCAEVENFSELVVGRDPFQVEAIVNDMHRGGFWGGGPISLSAISGIEQALMDIKGKALGVPVYELIGGKLRDRMRAYANGWSWSETLEPQDYARLALEMVALGFTGMKWDPFRRGGQAISKSEEEFAIECVGAVREAVGPQVDLLIECHGRFNVWSAVRMGRKLEQFDPFFFEEPILYDNVDALAEVARAINIPVAAGERLYTRWEFRSLLERHCVRIIQPDICHAGGIMELKKIATMAETYYVAVQPHNANGPISTLASMHLDATIPNFIIQEFFHPYLERYNQILTEPIQYEDGYLLLSDRPGLGADIDEAAAEKLPPEEKPSSLASVLSRYVSG